LACLVRSPPRPNLFPYTTLFRSAAEVLDRLGEVAHRHGAHTGERDLGTRLGGTDEAFQPTPSRTLGGGESAGNRPQPAVEREFRSEEHTSELQSRFDLVCRLLLE